MPGFIKNGIIKSLINFLCKSMDIEGEAQLEKEKTIGGKSECCCSDKDKSIYCFSNKIFCFFAMIIVLTIGIAIGKYLGERNNPASKFANGNVVELGGKTWVAYVDQAVNFTIINDNNCASCDTAKLEEWVKSAVPTSIGRIIDVSDSEASEILKKVSAKSVPVFIFDPNLDKISNFSQLSRAFDKIGDNYVLNLTKIGAAPGKFLVPPKILESDPQKGPNDAPIIIIEYSDFECPFCKQGFGIMKDVFNVYSGKVKMAYKQFPLPLHKNARNAANASLCANEQGKFWEIHDLMFANQNKLSFNDLKKYAAQSKVDIKKFNSCLDAKKYDSIIDADMAEGASFGISGTPAFFVNGIFVNGAEPLEEFKKIIDAELAAKK